MIRADNSNPANPIVCIGEQRSIYFDKGSFDTWCVFLRAPELNNINAVHGHAFSDVEWLTFARGLADTIGADNVIEDFTLIYNATERTDEDNKIDEKIIRRIDEEILGHYNDILRGNTEKLEYIGMWYCAIYMAMLAEYQRLIGSNKDRPSILEKRIKRVAFDMMMLDGMTPQDAFNAVDGRNHNTYIGFEKIKKYCRDHGYPISND